MVNWDRVTMKFSANLLPKSEFHVSNFLFVLLVSMASATIAVAETSSKCPGEEGFHYTNEKRRNPRAGGFVSNEASVVDDDHVTIEPEAAVCGSSTLSGRITLFGKAVVRNVHIDGTDRVLIGGSAKITGADISGRVEVKDRAEIRGNVWIEGSGTKGIRIYGDADLYNSSNSREMRILDQAQIFGEAQLRDVIVVGDTSRVFGKVRISGTVSIRGASEIQGFTKRSSGSLVDAQLNEPDYDAIAAAKAKATKEAQDIIDAKNAADAAKKKELADLQAKLLKYRSEIEDVYNQLPNSKLKFKDHCHFEIIDSVKAPYDLTARSNGFDRRAMSGDTPNPYRDSGVKLYRRGDDSAEVRMNSEIVIKDTKEKDGVWYPRSFQAPYEISKAFVQKMNFLWEHCKAQQ